MRSVTFAVRHRGAVVHMDKVAWEALQAQARANRDLAQALLLAMPLERGCSVPPGSDELQAWFQDGYGVAAVGEAIDRNGARGGAAARVEAFTQCDPGEFVEGGSGGGKWQCGTKRTPSVLELLCQKSLKSSVFIGVFPLMARRALVLVVRAMLLAT